MATARRVPITRVGYLLSYGTFGKSRRTLTINGHMSSADDVQDLLKNRHPGSELLLQSLEITFEDRF